jgi:hypothetical protein
MPKRSEEELPMKRLFAAAALCLALTAPALADGKIYVQLPDLSQFQGEDAEIMLKELILANIASSNCAGYEITDEEWSLLTDSADLLARGQLGLSIAEYDEKYFMPAFDEIDKPGGCDVVGARVQPMIDLMVEFGGSVTALADQEAGYQADLARNAAWDAATETPKKSKTK